MNHGDLQTRRNLGRIAALSGLVLSLAVWARPSAAQPTPGFPEPIVQWGVQKGETCEDIAKAMYGSAAHTGLLLRYNRIACVRGAPLRPGLTLVLPAKVTTVPSAHVTSINPNVRARPAGGGWGAAAAGMPLGTSSSVQTMETGRAGIRFIDRTRVYLASNTLVVVYGTASQTAVSKLPPPVVELQSGEVQAGLAALRGETVELSVSGGGRISAASRDTVVEQKSQRTTVAVFNGSADVRSANQKVSVPTNYGTRFYEAKPPIQPRPLPPAPAWEPGGSGAVVLGSAKGGLLSASWSAVPKAKAYRFEVAHDPAMETLITRLEVPEHVRTYRGEDMPPGSYYLRVRAIDDEEYLGIASPVRKVEVVKAQVDLGEGSVETRRIVVSPYGRLSLASPNERLELALDDGSFGPMQQELDFLRVTPKKVRLRVRGAQETHEIEVSYQEVKAAISAQQVESDLVLSVQLTGVAGVKLQDRVKPVLRVHWPDRDMLTVPLSPADSPTEDQVLLSTKVPISGAVEGLRVDVADQRGRVLGVTVLNLAAPAPPAEAPVEPVARAPLIGVAGAFAPFSPHADVLWTAPGAPNAATLHLGLAADADDRFAAQGSACASGSVGPVGIDAMLRTNSSESDDSVDTSAWLGARWRALQLDDSVLELGPVLRAGLPMSQTSPPARLEPMVALGGLVERWTWLADVGARIRLYDPADRTYVDPAQIFLLAGGTFDALAWLRLLSLLDGHVYLGEGLDGSGGLSIGLEAGEAFFGGLMGRLAPIGDKEGLFTGQVWLGIREP